MSESSGFALHDIALITNVLVNRHLAEGAHFKPATQDSGTGLVKQNPDPGIRICHANNSAQISMAYGDIEYAKLWCGLFDAGVTSCAYFDLREQLQAYETALNLDPGYLTDGQIEGITVFAHALPPLKDPVTPTRKNHPPDHLMELARHLRMLVKDLAGKLQTSNLCRIGECAGCRDFVESLSK